MPTMSKHFESVWPASAVASTRSMRLVNEFPDYAAFAKPQPLSIAEVQRLLAPHEALVLIVNRPHQSVIWVVAKDAVHWNLVDQGEDDEL